MTHEEAIDYIENEIKIDVALCNDNDIENHIECFKMAQEALGKQIPKKPINNSKHEQNGRVFYDISQYKCPVCKSRVKSGMGSSSRYRNNFCNHCGQALDWGKN